MPGHVFAQIVAALAAGLAHAAGQRAVHDDRIARLEIRHAVADGNDFAGCFGADDERQLAFGERHAAKAPDVDMIESDRADANLHLAGRGGGGAGRVGEFKLAVSNKHEREHAHLQTMFTVMEVSDECLAPPKARRQPAIPRR